jgi:hypothetical protein
MNWGMLPASRPPKSSGILWRSILGESVSEAVDIVARKVALLVPVVVVVMLGACGQSGIRDDEVCDNVRCEVVEQPSVGDRDGEKMYSGVHEQEVDRRIEDSRPIPILTSCVIDFIENPWKYSVIQDERTGYVFLADCRTGYCHICSRLN